MVLPRLGQRQRSGEKRIAREENERLWAVLGLPFLIDIRHFVWWLSRALIMGHWYGGSKRKGGKVGCEKVGKGGEKEYVK